MSRAASLLLACLVALAPILGDECLLRCHHQVACHDESSPAPAQGPCHESADAATGVLTPSREACETSSSAPPALRPGSDGSLRVLSAPSTIAATPVVLAISTSAATFVVLTGRQLRVSSVHSRPLRL